MKIRIWAIIALGFVATGAWTADIAPPAPAAPEQIEEKALEAVYPPAENGAPSPAGAEQAPAPSAATPTPADAASEAAAPAPEAPAPSEPQPAAPSTEATPPAAEAPPAAAGEAPPAAVPPPPPAPAPFPGFPTPSPRPAAPPAAVPVPGVPAPPPRPVAPAGPVAPPAFPGAVLPTRPGTPAPAFRAPAAAAGGGFLVKFNNADVYEVIHTLGRIAGINYLIDPRVRGVVNVHTQGPVRKEDALEILFSILRVNGATAVLEGNVYHIVPMNEAKMEPLPVERKEDPFSPNRPTMKAFPLQFIAASEMAKVIKPFLSAGGDAIEVPRANMLLVVDTAGNMEKHARLVELFDADAFRSAGVRMFPLKFLDPEEMGKNLDAIFGALDFGTKGGRPSGINFVPLARLNALLVVSASPKTLEDVERWIGELDREPSSTSRTVRLYRVKHGKVNDVAAILEKLYPGKAAGMPSRPTEFKPAVGEPMGRPSAFPGVTIETKTPETRPRSTPAAGVERKDGEGFDIIPDEPTNSLIIRGSASEYAAILETLKTIDVYPRQVLLEVLIGDVTLDDTLRLGIDWNYVRQSGSLTHTLSNVTGVAGLATGFSYAVEKTNQLQAAFRSLANDGKASVLSSPSVLAVNGKKSRIQVADQVPIQTASIIANSNPPVTTTTVEYRDVGVILTFTPFINDEGTVTLEIEQEVSEISTTISTTAGGNPAFLKRSVQTALIASSDQSIVLGGLVRERKSRSRDGLPFFYKIPLLGWIFGSRSDTFSRNELLIFITPRVIRSVEEGTRLSREFEDRVLELKERMGEAKGMKRAPAEPQEGN